MAFAQKNFVSLVTFVHQVAVYRDVCTTIGGFRGGAFRNVNARPPLSEFSGSAPDNSKGLWFVFAVVFSL